MQRSPARNGQQEKPPMKVLIISALSLMIINTSCKKSGKNEQVNKICFKRTLTELKIENNTNTQFYFTAFGRNILPVIDWTPTCSNNNVLANGSASRELSGIVGYSDNDLLVVYWWQCSGNNPSQMQSVILDKNESVCR